MKRTLIRCAFGSLAVLSWSAWAQQIDYSQPSLMGDQPDSWQPYVGVSYGYDENLFRLPTASIQPGEPTSDTSWTREAGIGFDHIYSRQHITANLDINRTTFERFNFIDYQGKDASFNWDWGLTNDFDGSFGETYSNSLTPYTQFHEAQLNLRTQKNDYFKGTWHLSPNWRMHSSVSNYTLDYDLVSQQFNDRTTHLNDLGFDFVSDQGNVLGLLARREEGGFPVEQPIGPFLINNNYVQDELDTELDWTVSGLTHIQFVGGWARRSYQEFTIRDVSGPSARLNATYIATGKTTFNLALWRAFDESDNLSVQYTIDKGISLTQIWDALPKVRVQGMLKEEKFDYTNSALLSALLPQNRVDTDRNATLTATYTPTRHVQVSLAMYTDRLDSTAADTAYRDRGLLLNARVAF